ncbi:outer membrane beta-barrel protein [Sphingomonas sp.]|uniref:outer membrane beta-barrel protein n=1 Tax=Sphingomonas sp. TaxID=28214 RepID=UPI002DECACD9|nr:outer membrane beta-barrel protein [Sphingomonas sp.]
MTKSRWLVLLLTGAANAALAQTTATRPQTFGAAPRVNAGAPSRQIDIRASVEASYDSNVFGVGSGGLLNRRSRDDFSLTPSLLLNVTLPFGRNSAFIRGQIGYDFYVKNSQLNRERISLDGGANLAVAGSCVVSPSAGYARLRSNAGDIFVADADGFRARNNVQESTSFGAQAQCGSATGISPSIGYRHISVRNSSAFLEGLDSDQDVIDGSIGYQRPSLGRIALYGSYAKAEYLGRDVNGNVRRLPIADFPINPAFDPDALDGVTNYSAGIRFERNIGSRIFGAVAVGYSWVNPKSANARKFRGNNYSLNLGLRPTDRLSIDLLASRSADVSNTVFATYSVTEVYSLNGTYRFNPRLSLNFGSSYQTRDYRTNFDFGQGQVFTFLDEDKFTRGYVGVAYDLNRRLRLTGLFSQQGRKANNSLFNYTNSTVTVGASYRLGR